MIGAPVGYTCPPGYDLHIDLDANTQWCQGAKDPNQIVPAQPKQQAMGVFGTSALVAVGLLVAAAVVSMTRQPSRKSRKSGRRR